MSAARAGERMIERCRDLGFALAGVCDAEPSDRGDDYRRWIDEGKHGSMAYLERHVAERLDPAMFVPGARSIIVVADQYASRDDAPEGALEGAEPAASPRGRIARYARGDDYHRVMKRRLHALCDALRAAHPGHEFRACVDTAPLLEREHAARAGLGWIGKHTLLIHPRRGSWLLLGAVVTTLAIDVSVAERPVPDRCGTCTRCIDACPTGAITPYSVDATRCVSYLTIERRAAIDPALFGGMGSWLVGCDVCQEVCPHNSPRGRGPGSIPVGGAHRAYAERRSSFDLLGVLGWTEEDRRAAVARSAMKRVKLPMFRRNAVIALGNGLARRADAAVRGRIESIAGDAGEDALVRTTACAALDRLG